MYKFSIKQSTILGWFFYPSSMPFGTYSPFFLFGRLVYPFYPSNDN